MIGFLAALYLATSTPPPLSRQETPAPRWSQEELERVSDEIKAEVEKLRGLAFLRPVQVRLTDNRGFLEYVKKRQELSMSPGRIERDETVAKLLGLIAPDLDLVATFEKFVAEQVGGFYDPSTDTFFLMESFTGGIAKVILAHELTHALDDQHFDIDGTLEKLGEDSDATFAYHAVVEGSGTATMNRWTLQKLGEKALDTTDLTAASTLGSKGLSEAPPYIWKPLIAAYLRGEGFLVRTAGMNIAMKAAENEDVRRAFKDPPRSSEQILHPEKYWDEARRDEPRQVRFDVAGLSPEWKVLGEDTLGELVLALVAAPLDRKGFDAANPLAILGLRYTNEAAEGWGGDRVVLLAKGDLRCIDFVTVWDRPEDAREFEAALRGVAKERLGSSEIHVDESVPSVELRLCRGSSAAEAGLPKIPWEVTPASKPPSQPAARPAADTEGSDAGKRR